MTALAYPEGHPYHHIPIGSMADLDAVTLDDARAFFRANYAPDNAVLAVVGDIDPEQTRRWVEKYFGSIPSCDGKVPPRDSTLPDIIGAGAPGGDPGGGPGARADGRLPDAARRHARVRRGRAGAHRPRRRHGVPALQPAGAPRPHRRHRRRRAGAARWRPLAGLAGRESLRRRRDPAAPGRHRRGTGVAARGSARRRGGGTGACPGWTRM